MEVQESERKFKNMVDSGLYLNITRYITQIDPLIKSLLGTIEALIENFISLKNSLEKGKEVDKQIQTISVKLKEAKTFSITLKGYLNQIIGQFTKAIETITRIMDAAVTSNNKTTAAKAISVQKILADEKEFLLTLNKALDIIVMYDKKLSNDGPNYRSAIIETTNTEEVTSQLLSLKTMIENLLLDKKRNILSQVNLARSIVYYTQEIGSN